ncbi:MAG: DUF3078 domain-containing protein [Paludibacteraceae bacterium]
MRTKLFIFVTLCAWCATTVAAQEVDKSVVETQAKAAQAAAADLQKVDTGEKAWKFTGAVGLNAAATGLWNWAAGGNNNVNGVAYTKLRLLYHENSMAWETNLDLEYGLSWIDQDFDKLQKTSDKINFSTKFGWEFHKTWYLTVLGGFQSQFAYGRDYNGTEKFDPVISKFLAPSYTDISVGIDWKPNDIFSVYLSPVAGRLTTAYVSKKLNDKSLGMTELDADGNPQPIYADGLDYALKEKYAVWHYVTDADGLVEKKFDRNLRAELGLSLKGSINYTYKDLKIITSLVLYTPYAWDKTKVYKNADGDLFADLGNAAQDFSSMEYVGYRDNNRRFGNFDVDWDVSISYQFLKCLQVSLTTSLKYYNGTLIEKFDKDGTSLGSAERVQFKSVLGLGIGYSF